MVELQIVVLVVAGSSPVGHPVFVSFRHRLTLKPQRDRTGGDFESESGNQSKIFYESGRNWWNSDQIRH